MPKIIENVREQLLKEAKKQLSELGYAKTTIRSVARECDLAIGTVYNYFKSKDALIASFMSEEWLLCLKENEKLKSNEPYDILKQLYNALRSFEEKYKSLFSDTDAIKVFSTAFFDKHKLLRDQLAALILPICKGSKDPEFLALFIAEALLSWTGAGRSFEQIYGIIKLLFDQK